MTNLNESWWFNQDNNAQTNRAINEFSASTLAAQHRLRTSLEAQGKQTKSLAERLERVERAILAVVALEDARELLAPFRAEQTTREFARGILAGQSDIVAPDDVAGYWLAPAARTVAAWGQGADGVADAAETRRRDAERGALFVTAASALAGRDTEIPAALVPPASGDVTPIQRTIWVEAAAGRFGEAGRRSVTDALRAVVAAADPAELRTMLDRRLPIRTSRASAVAVARLDALRVWLTTVSSTAEPAKPAEPGADPLAGIVSDLVSEGTEPERSLLQAVGNARAAIAALTTAPAPPPRPQHAEARTALAWLISDIDGSGTSTPALRTLAVTVLTEAIDGVAVAMTDDAANPPPEIDKPAPLRASSAAKASVASEFTSAAAVAATEAAARRQETWALAAAALCVLGVILGVVVAPAWFVLAVIGGVAAGVLWNSAVTAKRSAAARAASSSASERRVVTGAAGPPGRDVVETRAARAADMLAAVRAELARFAPVSQPALEHDAAADSDAASDQDSASSGAT